MHILNLFTGIFGDLRGPSGQNGPTSKELREMDEIMCAGNSDASDPDYVPPRLLSVTIGDDVAELRGKAIIQFIMLMFFNTYLLIRQLHVCIVANADVREKASKEEKTERRNKLRRMWHAAVAAYRKKLICESFSIKIEVEVSQALG